jgi:type II secretion system protein H
MRRVPTRFTEARHQRAFTLIELLLVMTVLVIAISVVTPALSGFFRGRTLDLEARQLLALMHAGQSRAVSEGLPVLLWVNAPQHAYGLAEETPARNGDPKALDFTLDDGLQLEAVNAAPVPVNGRSLPAIRFLPDGSVDDSSPVTLRLTSADGSALWLVQSAGHANYEIRNTSQP